MADVQTLENIRKGLTALSSGVNTAKTVSAKGKQIMESVKNADDDQLADGITKTASSTVGTVAAVTGKNIPYVGQALDSTVAKDGVKNAVGMFKGQKTLRDTASDGHTMTAIQEGVADAAGTAAGVWLTGYTANVVDADYVKSKTSPALKDGLKHPAGQVLGLVRSTVDITQDAVNVGHGNIWSDRVKQILVGKEGQEGMLNNIPKAIYLKMDEVHMKAFGGKHREEKKHMKAFNDFCDKIKNGIDIADNKLYETFKLNERDKITNKALDRVNDCLGTLYVDNLEKMKDNKGAQIQMT